MSIEERNWYLTRLKKELTDDKGNPPPTAGGRQMANLNKPHGQQRTKRF